MVCRNLRWRAWQVSICEVSDRAILDAVAHRIVIATKSISYGWRLQNAVVQRLYLSFVKKTAVFGRKNGCECVR